MFVKKFFFLQVYNINFGYTQVLFMGSVPRINCLPTIKNIIEQIKVFQLHNNYLIHWKLSNYIIVGNSKAAKGLLVYLEVSSICTANSISLSQSSRQLLYR